MKTKSYILLTLLYSTTFINANEYTQAIKYNDLERIEELNQGYEDININSVDDKTGLTPLQYASLYNPGVIKSLITNYELNIYKYSKSTPQSALNILLGEIETENDEQRIKGIIEIINFEKNKDFPNWEKLFLSNNEDLIYKMIDKHLYMAIYYIYKNNIEIDNEKYIEYSYNNNPIMAFYFKKLTDNSIYIKSIKKIISNNNQFDIKMLLTDGKLYEYLKEIADIKETKENIKSLNVIKSYHKEFFKKIKKNLKQPKDIKLKSIIVAPQMVDLKLNEYKYKLDKFKRIIENNKIDNLKLLQRFEMSKKNQELEIYKYKNKYDKRLYLLRMEKEKQCDKIIQKIKIKNIKALEQTKIELKLSKDKIIALKETTTKSIKNKREEIEKIKETIEDKDKKIKELSLLKSTILKLEKKNDEYKQDKKADNTNIYHFLYLSIFFILLNVLSLFLARKHFSKRTKTD